MVNFYGSIFALFSKKIMYMEHSVWYSDGGIIGVQNVALRIKMKSNHFLQIATSWILDLPMCFNLAVLSQISESRTHHLNKEPGNAEEEE